MIAIEKCERRACFINYDGKMYKTDATDMQGIFRIIQSVPSPKAEPLKMWLAEVGKERIDEIIDPELTIERSLETYVQKCYSREWINQRLQAIQVRKELTDAWQDHGIQYGWEFAILTNEITQARSGMTTREYKDFKGLKKENLRDNMSTTELVLNMLAEAATKDITQISHPLVFMRRLVLKTAFVYRSGNKVALIITDKRSKTC